MKILIVEDNPVDLKLFTELLAAAGHETVPATGPDDARRLLTRQSVDLVLVDILLDGTDGLALVRELKAGQTTRAIPIIATSAVHEWPFERLARYAGCAAFIQKPVDTRRFCDQLADAATAGKTRTSPADP